MNNECNSMEGYKKNISDIEKKAPCYYAIDFDIPADITKGYITTDKKNFEYETSISEIKSMMKTQIRIYYSKRSPHLLLL